MTIGDVRAHEVSAPLHTPFVTAIRRTTQVDSILVEIIDSDGRSGWGEGVATWRITGDSLPSIRAAISGPLRDVVVGRDADDIAPVLRDVQAAIVGNTAAKAAVDVAIHDLAARRLDIPLARLLGTTTTSVRTDVTIPAGTPDEMAATAQARVDEGFDVLKVKVGDGGDDVDRLRTIRNAVGTGPLLRIDANQGWAPRTAVRIIRALEDADLGIELVEQPTPAADLDGLAFVTTHVDTPILADESVWSARDAIEVVRRRAADLVNVKLTKCGGLAPALQIAAVAAATDVGVLVGSMMETHVGVGAAVALTAAIGTPHVCDLDAAWWLASPPVKGGITYGPGIVTLSSRPGLGVELA